MFRPIHQFNPRTVPERHEPLRVHCGIFAHAERKRSERIWPWTGPKQITNRSLDAEFTVEENTYNGFTQRPLQVGTFNL